MNTHSSSSSSANRKTSAKVVDQTPTSAELAKQKHTGSKTPVSQETTELNPAALPPEETARKSQPPSRPEVVAARPKRSWAGGAWAGLIIGAILLIVLLVFILQNQETIAVNVFAWTLQLPTGVAILLAAISGALIMAFVGGFRMLDYRRELKSLRRR